MHFYKEYIICIIVDKKLLSNCVIRKIPEKYIALGRYKKLWVKYILRAFFNLIRQLENYKKIIGMKITDK